MAKMPEHLRLHHRLWRYDRYVDPELRPYMPEGQRGTRYRVYLKTPDLSVALRMRPRLDAQFAEMIEQAKKKRMGEDDPLKWAIDMALDTRRVEEEIDYPLGEEAHERAAQLLPKEAFTIFKDVYRTGVVPITIDQHLDEWLHRTRHLHGKTLLERKTVITNLKEWATVRGIGDIRKIERETAKLFMKEHEGKAASTISKVLQAVRGYWQFLKGEGVSVDPDIWQGLGAKQSRREALQDKERPFTDKELKALLSGTASKRLRDAMTIGLLTGMRLSEIGDLRVEHVDLKNKVIRVPGSKTSNAARTIPLHPSLVPLMKTRAKDKEGREHVIHELGEKTLQHGRKRAAALSQEFTRYRQAVGVDDTREGKRRALVNFHSFRRTADKLMIEAGIAPNVIDAFFGWKDQGTMRTRYAVGADLMRQMREAVVVLKLP